VGLGTRLSTLVLGQSMVFILFSSLLPLLGVFFVVVCLVIGSSAWGSDVIFADGGAFAQRFLSGSVLRIDLSTSHQLLTLPS
jgi:hypothetical protein